MKAEQTNLQRIIGMSQQQFIVPLFQRTYSWDKKEWQDLWDDILELYENDTAKNHFLGSIVTIPVDSVPQGIAKYVLIDGQQRLTTLFILLMLIRDHTMNKNLADKIHEQQLINKFAEGYDAYKLLPTQQDRPAFQTLLEPQAIRPSISPELEKTRIINCYRFFDKKLRKINVEKLSQIISNQLTVVSIVLDPNENPHLVFESLNARGKPLTQADLIRNYFFMRIPVVEQEKIFDRDWRPMQEALDENLTECIRHYLMAIKATDVKKTEVYITLKNWIAKANVLDSLKELATYASYYQKILYPEHEPVLSIQRALRRINRTGVTVAYPFLLRCYHDYKQGQLSEVDFGKILHFVENMVIRRYVCNLPSNALNKLFPVVHREAKPDYSTGPDYSTEFVTGVARFLQGKGYPNDEEFKEALTTTNFYSRLEGRERTKLVLESLESSYQHKEPVDFDKLTIEHVMPQTLNEWWQLHLGEEWETVHELYLHTLGNLTLTGYNPELSNKSFPDKQKGWLAQSHLELNRYFVSVTKWKKEQIEERAEQLADLALTVWPYFGDNQRPVSIRKRHEVTRTRPSRLVINNEELVVKTWRDVLEKTLNFWIKEDPEQFENLAVEYPKFISHSANAFRRSAELTNGYHVELNLSADHIYRFCQQVMEYFGYSKDDWRVDYQ
jgi:uncharacterized protein with ParB-like and HNH nuclease domain